MSRCAACPGVHRCLSPDGVLKKGGILFIGEAPGRDEERKGRVFVGKTGKEVDLHYLPVAGLKRSEVVITNAIRCLPHTSGHKLDPRRDRDVELLQACATHHLYPLIERMEPRLLVPMGGFATRAVLGEPLDLELHHGLPVDSPWGMPAFPMFHPALGIHEPKKMLYIRTDWYRLRQFIGGRYHRMVDAFAGVEDYAEITDPGELAGLLDRRAPLAMDTESRRGGDPYCVTFSQWPGAGRLIRAERRDLLDVLQSQLTQWLGPILFHNWLYDAAVVERMQLRLPIRRVVDTMARVFHLGNLPQGLKALAWRELGMAMEDFEDVVLPYSRRRVIDYYEGAATFEWPKPEEQMVPDGEGGLKLYRPQGMTTKLKRFFTDLKKAPDTKDVFGVWEKWDQEAIERECGEWPGVCISHVPFERVLHYACRDVDALIRLWPVIRRMRTRVRKVGQEQWRAA